jgi:hypothetical protein
MRPPAKLSRYLRARQLTRTRIVLALLIAVVADSVQFLLGPFGWMFGDPAIDVVVMLLMSWLLGFHWLFLPSFLLELFPLADELPTWTACVIAVIVLRKRQQRISPPLPSRKSPVEA